MSGSDIYERAVTVADAWATRRPTKTFFGMSLEAFCKIVAASTEARTELAALEARVREVLKRRDAADRLLQRAVIRVVNGVKGDTSEGEDSELLAAMGYLPHTARSSIVSAARRNAAKAALSEADGDDEAEG